MPRTSDDERAPLYEGLVDDLLIDPEKVSAEIAAGLAECREILANRLAPDPTEISSEISQPGEN